MTDDTREKGEHTAFRGSVRAIEDEAASSPPVALDVDGAIMVPTKLLRCEWPPNDGVMPGDGQFDALFESIKAEGMKVPLTIRLDWSVIDGAHRLSVARHLGIDKVPVRIWTGVEFVPSPRFAPPSLHRSPDRWGAET